MSADNWAMCPRCTKNHEDIVREREGVVANAYGKVPVAEFDAMRADLDALRSTEQRRTFRENYEFYGVEDRDEVIATYGGGCAVCGLTISFEHHHPFDVGGAS